MTAAQQLPEGFTSANSASGLIFQNAANWSKADLTGRMVQGVYLGTLEKDPYGKSNHKVQATVAGTTINKDGSATDYEKGATVIVNSSGSLDKQLLAAKVGDEVVIDFSGKIKIKKGPFKGKEANMYSVGIKKA